MSGKSWNLVKFISLGDLPLYIERLNLRNFVGMEMVRIPNFIKISFAGKDEWKDNQKDGWMDKPKRGWKDGWKNEGKVGWMDERRNGRYDGRKDRHLEFIVLISVRFYKQLLEFRAFSEQVIYFSKLWHCLPGYNCSKKLITEISDFAAFRGVNPGLLRFVLSPSCASRNWSYKIRWYQIITGSA